MATDPKKKLAIRTAYIVKRWSARRCADEFHVDITTIKLWASKEGWTRERNRNTTAGQSVAEEESRTVVRDIAARQQAYIDEMATVVVSCVKNCKAKLEKITNERAYIAATRDISEMFERFTKAIRIAGEDRPTERDDELIIEQRRLEPMKIAVGQDGRALPRPSDDDLDE